MECNAIFFSKIVCVWDCVSKDPPVSGVLEAFLLGGWTKQKCRPPWLVFEESLSNHWVKNPKNVKFEQNN